MGLAASLTWFAVVASLSTSCHANRKILQSTSLDCTLLHPQCVSCVPEVTKSSTQVICTRCTSPQYVASNRTCVCSPGYFPSTSLYTCEACRRGAYCSGGTGAAAARQSCGELLTTDSQTAADSSACMTLPGVAYMNGVSSAIKCPAGSYNMGGNRRNCTECPYGLTTAGTGATHIEVCSAPPGYFYRNRQALPCAVGSYTSGISKETSCQRCPVGTTTADIAATSATDCSLALPGYQPIVDAASKQVVGAETCPAGTYSPQGLSCIACPDGLSTQYPMQTDISACLAPPGYGYYPNTTSDHALAFNTTAAAQTVNNETVPTAAVLACPSGSYKAGWNLDSCVSCGVGFLTEPAPATSPDHCYLPPGYGSKREWATDTGVTSSASPVLVASKCTNGTYGSEEKQFGLEAMPCQPCPENTVTPDLNSASTAEAISTMFMTSVSNCSNIPGYGWQHGLAVRCPLGSFSPGFDLRPCVECGKGLISNITGATSMQDCQALPGWAVTHSGNAEPCPAGAWSAGVSAPCQLCPQGSTTAGPAATAVTDCSICSPGWGGVPLLETSQGRVLCAPCVFGTYSPGGTSLSCIPCEPGYISPARSTDSSACYPQWSTQNPHTWIPTPTAAMVPASAVAAAAAAAFLEAAPATVVTNSYNLLSASAAPNTPTQIPLDADSCQAACGGDSGCQYYVFMTGQQDSAQDGCWFKLQTASPAPNTYLSFKLGTGDYTIYAADQGYDAQIGSSVAWTSSNPEVSPTTPSSCINACDGKAACLGTWVSNNISSTIWECRLLAGEFRNDVTSSIQAVPQHINNNRWAKDCIGRWGGFSACNQTCGGGVQVAQFTVIQPASEDGAQCDFADGATKNQTCNADPCPVDCVGGFSDWSECSALCGGGSQTAVYTITTPAAHGGRACDGVDGAVTNQTCNNQPCPVDCEGSWVWEPCSVACGGGKQSAVYAVTIPSAFGGSDCEAADGETQTKKCNTWPCPIDCIGAWGDYSPCSASCGGGSEVSTYTISQPADFGGMDCETADGSTKRRTCNPQPCAPVDCVGHWELGPCNQSCGGGVQVATFRVEVPAAHAGRECVTTDGDVRQQLCNIQACQDIPLPAGTLNPPPATYGSVQHINITMLDGPTAAATNDSAALPGPPPAQLDLDIVKSTNVTGSVGDSATNSTEAIAAVPDLTTVKNSSTTTPAEPAAAANTSTAAPAPASTRPALRTYTTVKAVNITKLGTVAKPASLSQPATVMPATNTVQIPQATGISGPQPNSGASTQQLLDGPALSPAPTDVAQEPANATVKDDTHSGSSTAPASPSPSLSSPTYNTVQQVNITSLEQPVDANASQSAGEATLPAPTGVPGEAVGALQASTYSSRQHINITALQSHIAASQPARGTEPTQDPSSQPAATSQQQLPVYSSRQQINITGMDADTPVLSASPSSTNQPAIKVYSSRQQVNFTALNRPDDASEPANGGTPSTPPDAQPVSPAVPSPKVYSSRQQVNITALDRSINASQTTVIAAPAAQPSSAQPQAPIYNTSMTVGTLTPSPSAPSAVQPSSSLYGSRQHINITALDKPMAASQPVSDTVVTMPPAAQAADAEQIPTYHSRQHINITALSNRPAEGQLAVEEPAASAVNPQQHVVDHLPASAYNSKQQTNGTALNISQPADQASISLNTVESTQASTSAAPRTTPAAYSSRQQINITAVAGHEPQGPAQPSISPRTPTSPQTVTATPPAPPTYSSRQHINITEVTRPQSPGLAQADNTPSAATEPQTTTATPPALPTYSRRQHINITEVPSPQPQGRAQTADSPAYGPQAAEPQEIAGAHAPTPPTYSSRQHINISDTPSDAPATVASPRVQVQDPVPFPSRAASDQASPVPQSHAPTYNNRQHINITTLANKPVVATPDVEQTHAPIYTNILRINITDQPQAAGESPPTTHTLADGNLTAISTARQANPVSKPPSQHQVSGMPARDAQLINTTHPLVPGSNVGSSDANRSTNVESPEPHVDLIGLATEDSSAVLDGNNDAAGAGQQQANNSTESLHSQRDAVNSSTATPDSAMSGEPSGVRVNIIGILSPDHNSPVAGNTDTGDNSTSSSSDVLQSNAPTVDQIGLTDVDSIPPSTQADAKAVKQPTQEAPKSSTAVVADNNSAPAPASDLVGDNPSVDMIGLVGDALAQPEYNTTQPQADQLVDSHAGSAGDSAANPDVDSISSVNSSDASPSTSSTNITSSDEQQQPSASQVELIGLIDTAPAAHAGLNAAKAAPNRQDAPDTSTNVAGGSSSGPVASNSHNAGSPAANVIGLVNKGITKTGDNITQPQTSLQAGKLIGVANDGPAGLDANSTLVVNSSDNDGSSTNGGSDSSIEQQQSSQSPQIDQIGLIGIAPVANAAAENAEPSTKQQAPNPSINMPDGNASAHIDNQYVDNTHVNIIGLVNDVEQQPSDDQNTTLHQGDDVSRGNATGINSNDTTSWLNTSNTTDDRGSSSEYSNSAEPAGNLSVLPSPQLGQEQPVAPPITPDQFDVPGSTTVADNSKRGLPDTPIEDSSTLSNSSQLINVTDMDASTVGSISGLGKTPRPKQVKPSTGKPSSTGKAVNAIAPAARSPPAGKPALSVTAQPAKHVSSTVPVSNPKASVQKPLPTKTPVNSTRVHVKPSSAHQMPSVVSQPTPINGSIARSTVVPVRPAVNITPPALKITPPALNMTPPDLNITPPDLNIAPPALSITPPVLNITSTAVSRADASKAFNVTTADPANAAANDTLQQTGKPSATAALHNATKGPSVSAAKPTNPAKDSKQLAGWIQQLGRLVERVEQYLNRTTASSTSKPAVDNTTAAPVPLTDAIELVNSPSPSPKPTSAGKTPPKPAKSVTSASQKPGSKSQPGKAEGNGRIQAAEEMDVQLVNISSAAKPGAPAQQLAAHTAQQQQQPPVANLTNPDAEKGTLDCLGYWSWTPCTAKCGGTQTATYRISRPAANGGRACQAVDGATKSQACNTQACAHSYDQLKCLLPDQILGLAPGITMQCSTNSTLQSFNGSFMTPESPGIHCPGGSQLMLALPCTEAGQWRLAYSNNVGSYVWVTVEDSLAAAEASAAAKCTDSASCMLAATTVTKAMVDANIKCSAGQYVVLHEQDATMCLGLAAFSPAAQAEKESSKGWGDWGMNCYGRWTESKPCSEPCGIGRRTMVYNIVTPPTSAGKLCPVADGTVRLQACNRQPCDGQ